ncbi:MAG: metallophosphoesterase [Deltaproteobacteria bacterium]|nr:metallophosphoesterase [Deltaproteobacteria bacterium]MBW2446186.1 metallophosphoesterase [Deltaproteobacteria bacterium]
MKWSELRSRFFGNLFTILSGLLGVFQVLIGHWIVVVFAGREGPGWVSGLLLAAALVAANMLAMPNLRRAARAGGWPRRISRGYMALGITSLVTGLVIAIAWLGFLPLAGLLTVLGVSGDTAFEFFRLMSSVVVFTLVAMFAWGFTGGQRLVEETRIPVDLPGLPDSLSGLRIAHISDLHIGNGLEDARLDALVERVNAMEADLIALTGDIFDFDPRHVEDGARRLGALRARLGVFAVLGNHDHYTGREYIAESLGRHAPGIQLLRGDMVRVPGETPFYLAGVDDPGADWTARGVVLQELEDLGNALPADGPVVLLIHRPEAFPQAQRLGFPLVLAGHTHGGQLALPGSGHLNLARIVTRYHRGLYRENGSTLYVNRGIGVAGPAIRFNCPREIATIELR